MAEPTLVLAPAPVVETDTTLCCGVFINADDFGICHSCDMPAPAATVFTCGGCDSLIVDLNPGDEPMLSCRGCGARWIADQSEGAFADGWDPEKADGSLTDGLRSFPDDADLLYFPDAEPTFAQVFAMIGGDL
ncbi:hypothetical protein [Leifsonia sp. Leaf264]|uniref:hypothetical protein n=1 Tax=Leifsonia sp. Leaf264 TaxID=1736314 RepID=UPI0006FE6B12|nr:hypothetical protein [Leifsonia sp. Leaf264]KQO98189.1 hypothetical protein ASF30_09010 [Leifsonia sp. Leaf264]